MVVHEGLHLFPLNKNKLDSEHQLDKKKGVISVIILALIPLGEKHSGWSLLSLAHDTQAYDFLKFGTLTLPLCHTQELDILTKTRWLGA